MLDRSMVLDALPLVLAWWRALSAHPSLVMMNSGVISKLL